jgi:hypothetical protein
MKGYLSPWLSVAVLAPRCGCNPPVKLVPHELQFLVARRAPLQRAKQQFALAGIKIQALLASNLVRLPSMLLRKKLSPLDGTLSPKLTVIGNQLAASKPSYSQNTTL